MSSGDENELAAGSVRRLANLVDSEAGGCEVECYLVAVAETQGRVGGHQLARVEPVAVSEGDERQRHVRDVNPGFDDATPSINVRANVWS